MYTYATTIAQHDFVTTLLEPFYISYYDPVPIYTLSDYDQLNLSVSWILVDNTNTKKQTKESTQREHVGDMERAPKAALSRPI